MSDTQNQTEITSELRQELDNLWSDLGPRRRLDSRALEGRGSVSQAIGRYLIDPHFRAMYHRDARWAVQNAGLALTAFEFTVLDEVTGQLKTYAEDPSVRRLSERMINYQDRIKV
jgi:hypothetical protein